MSTTVLQSWDKPANEAVSVQLSAGADGWEDGKAFPLHISGQLKNPGNVPIPIPSSLLCQRQGRNSKYCQMWRHPAVGLCPGLARTLLKPPTAQEFAKPLQTWLEKSHSLSLGLTALWKVFALTSFEILVYFFCIFFLYSRPLDWCCL